MLARCGSPVDAVCGLIRGLRSTLLVQTMTSERADLPAYIERLVLRGPYRRSACSAGSVEDVSRKIADSLRGGEPIRFTVPFGGYKLWRLESAPLPDWAEVFAAAYLVEYLMPVAWIYEPGIEIVFSYCSLGVSEANGLEVDSISTYIERFGAILGKCQDLVQQANLTMRVFDVATLYGEGEGEKELAELLAETKSSWSAVIPLEDRERMIASARRNLRLSGKELSTDELEARYEESAQLVYAVDSLKKRREFNKYSDRIQLVYVRGPERSIHVGSCRSSTCQFNVGSGVLEARREGYIPRIASADFLRQSRHLGVADVQRCWPELALLDTRFRTIELYSFQGE